MWLRDHWSKLHILDAQHNGEFDSLAGTGASLKLKDDSDHQAISKKLALLELKLQQSGMSADFLRRVYVCKLLHKFDEE